MQDVSNTKPCCYHHMLGSYGALNECVTWKMTLFSLLNKGLFAAANVILKLELVVVQIILFQLLFCFRCEAL